VAAERRDRLLQAGDVVSIGPAAFNAGFDVSLALVSVSSSDLDGGETPLHYQVHQLFGSTRNFRQQSCAGTSRALRYGHADIGLPTTNVAAVIYSDPLCAPEAQFRTSLAQDLAKTKSRAVLLFVHGYRNSFEDAQYTSGALRHGTRFEGVSLFFSWPSRGRLLGYWKDEREAAGTVEALKEFLLSVQAANPARINIVAHSMGNRIVTAALHSLAGTGRFAGTKPFGEIVLAAADMDPETLKERFPAILAVADRVTIYYSANDRATAASAWINGSHVVGARGIAVSLEGVDVIDASGVSNSLIGHNYLDEMPVLHDLFDLLHNKNPANKRFLEMIAIGERQQYRILPLRLGNCSCCR
jgi:pimeloyl-ACP methyl ester carboxylesterase